MEPRLWRMDPTEMGRGSRIGEPGIPESQNGGIAWKELLPIIMASAVWGRQWIGGVSNDSL